MKTEFAPADSALLVLDTLQGLAQGGLSAAVYLVLAVAAAAIFATLTFRNL